MTDTDSEGDRLAWKRFCLIADKIGADPSLLHIPRVKTSRLISNRASSRSMAARTSFASIEGQGSASIPA